MLDPKNVLIALFWIALSFAPQQLNAQCDQDILAPVLTAPADVVMSCLDVLDQDLFDVNVRNQLFGDATVFDNCPVTVIETTNFLNFGGSCNTPTLNRHWLAEDENGNTAEAQQLVVIEYEQSLHFSIPADASPGDDAGWLETIDAGCSSLGMSWESVVFGLDCDGELDEYHQNFRILDWCEIPSPITTFVTLPRLDINQDGIVGDAYDIQITSDGVFLLENGVLGDSIAPPGGQFFYRQENDLFENTEAMITIQGAVFNDTNDNCELNTDEIGVPNYGIKVKNISNGTTAFTFSDALGDYVLDFCANGDTIEISSNNPYYASGTCLSTTTVVLDTVTTTLNLDIPLQIPCGQLLVDIGTWNLRRCFNNTYYVSYQNINPVAQTDVYIEVELDPFMQYTSSSIPAFDLGNNIYRFDIGDLAALESGSFSIKFDLSCDATLGQTHCSAATIYPAIMCDTLDTNWSGASLEVNAACIGDSLNVKIQNVGISDMEQSSDYIIVEDVIMMSINPFQLIAGEMHSFNLPANGSVWHVAVDQVPFHPGNSQPSVTVEGCGGVNNPGLGMAFPQNDAGPGMAIDCRINIGSFDPNDKQAAPAGVGADRDIEANVGMEYMIRFQNTGTDTAFTVVIEDELSEYLDANSVRPGVASHAYIFERYEDNKLRFTFNDIMLPDSTVDLEGSNGFVKFNIQQQPDNAPNTVIHNQAAIYFDFNEPVITNDAFVTISDHPFGVINYLPEADELSQLTIFPNPTHSEATLLFDHAIEQPMQLKIYNINGQLLLTKVITSQKTALDFAAWPEGIYPIELKADGAIVERGKLVKQ